MIRGDGVLSAAEVVRYYRDLSTSLGCAPRTPAEGQALVGRVRLRYLEWGEPTSRPALVLLHGGGLNVHTWDAVAMLVSADHHVVAIDLRGHGASEWSPQLDYGLPDHADDVREALALLGIRSYVLVGMSLGGFVSLRIATSGPGEARGIVLVDVSTRVRLRSARQIRGFIAGRDEFDSVDDAVEYVRAHRGGRVPGESSGTTAPPATAPPVHRTESLRTHVALNLMRLATGRLTWRYDRRHRTMAELDAMLDDAAMIEESLPRLRCPLLLVVGADSDVLDPDEPARLTGLLTVPARAVTVEGAGHSVQRDAPVAVARLLVDFLDEVAMPQTYLNRPHGEGRNA
ncbi:alpha/beta fold hydrolase [Actinophytocola sp.]|uniref:alpha/beta fold hydrolase n=1 Tax=Actinophytocola sp. TaxID=1872138 RepID=UPI003D6C3B37